MGIIDKKYVAGPTLSQFHQCDEFVRGVRGPVRSGKSYGMCWEVVLRGLRQEAYQGTRWTRTAIVRNTYRELYDTTIQTWLRLWPESEFGVMNKTDRSHCITTKDMRCEVVFRALDRPDDISKLLSSEYTSAWVNEAREVPKGVIDTLTDRIRQIPPKDMGGCTWGGLWMDTNSPDTDHWWYTTFEELRPDGWRAWSQPGALIKAGHAWVMNPAAENIENLNEPDYYLTRLAGKSEDYIKVYYANMYGFSADGKPVIPDYVDEVHCKPVSPDKRLPLFIGIDFGLTPAAVFGQTGVNGQRRLVDELVTEDMGAKRFGELLKQKINAEYRDFEIHDYWADPAGDGRSQTDEHTCFEMLKASGIMAKPAYSNDPVLRFEAISAPMRRMIDGQPGFVIDPRCKITRKGLAGGYCYKRLQVSGEERFRDVPEKSRYSHPVDAAGYMLMCSGEGSIATGKNNRKIVLPRAASDGGHSGWMGQ